jgi:hypothetical protein
MVNKDTIVKKMKSFFKINSNKTNETKTTEIQANKTLTEIESIDLARLIYHKIKNNIREFINYSNSSIRSVSLLSYNLKIINESLNNILNLIILIYNDPYKYHYHYKDNNKDLLIKIIDLLIKIITIINNYFYINYNDIDNNYIIKGFKLTVLLKNLKKIIIKPFNNTINDKLINDKLINDDTLIKKFNSLNELNTLLCNIDSDSDCINDINVYIKSFNSLFQFF